MHAEDEDDFSLGCMRNEKTALSMNLVAVI